MSRYIDADALRAYWLENGENEYVYDTNAFLDSIDNAPTADVAHVRHGQWEDRENPQWRAYEIRHCSVCGWSIHKTKLRNADLKWNYCPNCGCRMDEKEGE